MYLEKNSRINGEIHQSTVVVSMNYYWLRERQTTMENQKRRMNRKNYEQKELQGKGSARFLEFLAIQDIEWGGICKEDFPIRAKPPGYRIAKPWAMALLDTVATPM